MVLYVQRPAQDGEAVHAGRIDDPEAKKALGVLGLASLAFFAVAGSPAGSEDSVAAGGALWTLLGFIILPLVWSVPEALVTAELATAFPHNGGYVIWVSEAFGGTAGYMEGLLKWSAGVLDSAVYPVQMLNYLRKIFPILRNDVYGRLVMAGMTLVLSMAQYGGLGVVGVTSNVVIVLTMLPFVVLVVYGMPTVDWDLVVAEKPLAEVDWSLLLINLFWNLNYWDAVSTLAAEVQTPKKTFPRALALALIFTVLMYVLVLGVAIGNTPADASWDDAELADAGVWVAGNWLRIWIVASICVSTTGLFLADLATSIYQLEGMASMGMLPKFIGLKNSRGVPVVALVFQVIIVMALDQAIGSMEDIIAYEMIGYCAAMVLEFCAFVRLRMTHADVERPFKVPGGLGCASALVAPAIVFSGIVMGLSDWTVWVAGGAQIVGAIGLALLFMRMRRSYPRLFNSTSDECAPLLGEATSPRSPRSGSSAKGDSSPEFEGLYIDTESAIPTTHLTGGALFATQVINNIS